MNDDPSRRRLGRGLAALNGEIDRAKAALATAETRLTDAERAHTKARQGL